MTLLDKVRLGKYSVHSEALQDVPALANKRFLQPVLDAAVPVEITNAYEWVCDQWSDSSDSFEEPLYSSFPVTWWQWTQTRNVSPAVPSTVGLLAIAKEHEVRVLLFDDYVNPPCLTHDWTLRCDSSTGALEVEYRQTGDGSDGIPVKSSIILYLAQSLMHCRNVVTIVNRIPTKLAKKANRKHGLAPTPYRTICIEPMKTIIQQAGGVQKLGCKKVMHIVRGHFATYKEEKPLFGCPGNVGRFFRSSHVRGDASIGAKKSDYEVRAPQRQ